VWARAKALVEAWANERVRDMGCRAWALVQAGVVVGMGVGNRAAGLLGQRETVVA
jgi:hypothetical protein